MPAAITDKFNQATNGTRPVPTTLTATRAIGASSITVGALTGWPTATAVHFSIYQVDTSGNKVAGSQTDWKGTASGTTISNLTLEAGSDSGDSVGAIVECGPTAAWANDVVDGILVSHDQDGTLKDGAVDAASVLASNVVTTAKILDSNVTTAKINDDAVTTAKVLNSNITTAKIADDAVTDAKLLYGKVRTRQGGSATNWSTTGTTTYDYSGTNTFIQVGAKAISGQSTTVTFPTAFNQIPIVTASPGGSAGLTGAFYLVGVTTTEFVFVSEGNSSSFTWIAIGE